MRRVHIAWLQACFNVIVLWCLAGVGMRVAGTLFDVHTFVFTSVAFLSASVLLLILGAKGSMGLETIKNYQTWAYAAIIMVGYMVQLMLYTLSSTFEGIMLLRLTIPIAIFIGWLFAGRVPRASQWFGTFLIMCGIALIVMDFQEATREQVLLWMFVASVASTLQIVVAEFHSQNAKAEERASVADRCRVIGFIMFITSSLFLGGSLLFSVMLPSSGSIFHAPALADFQNPYNVWGGMLLGAVLVAPLRYLEFSSTRIIKTENYLALAAMSPLSIVLCEMLLDHFGILDLKTISPSDWLAFVLITTAALIMVYARIRSEMGGKFDLRKYIDKVEVEAREAERQREKVELDKERAYADALQAAQDSRDIVLDTMKRYKNYVPKVADLLDLPESVVESIVEDTKGELTFKPDVLKTISRNYRQNVSNTDPLTGLKNRHAFEIEMEQAFYTHDVFSVLFIDLNKFKPVNDTWGHDVGDRLLQSVGNRMEEVVGANDLVARLGGDEYGVILYGENRKQAIKTVEKIKKAIAKPYTFEGVKPKIEVTASAGFASFPEDGKTATEIMKKADKAMYGDKGERGER